MGHQDRSTDTDPDKIRPASAEKIEWEKVSHTHIHVLSFQFWVDKYTWVCELSIKSSFSKRFYSLASVRKAKTKRNFKFNMGHSMPSVHTAWPRPSPIFIKFDRVNIFGPNMKNPKFCDNWLIPAPMRRKTCFWDFTKITIFKRLYLWKCFTKNCYILRLGRFFHVEYNGVLEIRIKRRLLCAFWEYIINLHFWRSVYIFISKLTFAFDSWDFFT